MSGIQDNRAPAANSEGNFGLPGVIREHHAPDCECRPCRRLRNAENRRWRKRLMREVTQDQSSTEGST